MSDLFLDAGATFNEARTHRQNLWRRWDDELPGLIVVGMNPSKADETDNDPTVERCQRRADAMGYGKLVMLNILDVIETDSRLLDRMDEMRRCTDENYDQLRRAVSASKAGDADILCAWGRTGQRYGDVGWFERQARRAGVTLFCLGKNKDGSPVHPLYQPYARPFERFGGVDEAMARQSLPLD